MNLFHLLKLLFIRK